jgi:hypothetical protein|tara:strand:+ start:970 stop:1296 length:327 start_codon:yes stop_codon:yes gene_type:complete
MDEITLTFPQPLNVSVQVGDTAYYTNDINGVEIVLIGLITAVTTYTITADIDPSQIRPTLASFILFSKTANVNTSGLKGYYAEMQIKNDTTEYAELFLVGSEIFESSK